MEIPEHQMHVALPDQILDPKVRLKKKEKKFKLI